MSFLYILYAVIAAFILTLIMLWCFIFIFILDNKVKAEKMLIFEKFLIEGFVSSYTRTGTNITNKKLGTLKRYIKKDSRVFWKSAKIFVKVNRIVKFAKNNQFKSIFRYLDIDEILRHKIDNKDWYVKARAIWLSYEFELEENLQAITAYRDDENTLVRREAQIALVTFLGWKSLAFFPYVTKRMSLWQQIRIIEKLDETEGELDLYYMEKALLSENVIIRELLIRIIKNFNFTHYKHFIVEQLFSNDWRLIGVAIDTLKCFDSTADEIKEIEQRLPEIITINQRKVISNYIESIDI